MNVCIVFPPQLEPETFPLGAVQLAARLDRGGAQVELVDANQLAWARWLDTGHLGRQVALMRAQRERLSACPTLQGSQAWDYCRALRGSVGSTLLLAQLEAARAELARPGPAARRAWAKRIVEAAQDIALWPVAGQASLHDLTLSHSTEVPADVLAAAAETASNPYAAFWAAWLDASGPLPDHIVIWLQADQQLVPAATLAAELVRRGVATRVHLDGPFAAFLRACDAHHGTADCGEVFGASAAGLSRGIAPAPDAARLRHWLQACLAQRVLGAPVVALGAADDGMAGACAQLALLHDAAPRVHAHLDTPRCIEELLAIGEASGGAGTAWSATLRFGFDLDASSVAQLRAAGCRALHFEVKGCAGYDLPQTRALATMLRSFERARSGGLVTLGSAVYGYSGDDDAAFAGFTAAMAGEPQALDCWVRFRLWRLYRHAEPWREPGRHGIARVFEADPRRRWCRHADFIGKHGLDSRTFAARAGELQPMLAQRGSDFPASPLISDDAGLGMSEGLPAADAPVATGAWLQAVPEDAVELARFDFATMERLLGAHVPGAGRPWPQQPFAAGPGQWLARGFGADRLSVIGSGTMQLLQRCRQPVEADAVAGLLARGGGDGPALLSRLVQAGMLRALGEGA